MKTSWHETRLIDRNLNAKASTEENLLHDAKQIVQPDYAEAILWQKKMYPIIKKYGQNKLRTELDMVLHKLFSRPSFRTRILNLFTKR